MTSDIRSRAERLARLLEEQAEIAAQISELKAEAKSDGYDTCRVLFERGITGEARMFGKGEASPRLLLDIERDAKWTISETDKGMRRVKWAPFATEITA